jgi:hypothetical protein
MRYLSSFDDGRTQAGESSPVLYAAAKLKSHYYNPKDHTMALKKTKVKSGKSLEDFRAAHDPNYILPRKIEAALKSLGNSWEYELDFMRRVGVSATQFAAFREQYEDFIVVVGGARAAKRAWCGTKTYAAKLREVVGA